MTEDRSGAPDDSADAAGVREAEDSGEAAESAGAADHGDAADSETTPAAEAVEGGGLTAAGDARSSERSVARRGSRPKRRELLLPDNHRLVLGPDRTIVHRDAEGAVVASWSPDDPEWARHALRFGLRPVEPTANPHDRHIRGSKPPGR